MKASLKKTLFFVVIILFFCVILVPEAFAETAEQDYKDYTATKHASSKWNALVKQGMEAYHEGNLEVAQKTLHTAFNQGCESPIVIFMLALLTEYQGSYYTALEYYQMAEKGFKKTNQSHRFNQTFYENYGRALYNSGKKDEALPLLTKAAKKTKSYDLLKMLGMLAYEKGDSLNALSYLERAVRIKSDTVTKEELVYVYSLLGKLFLHKGEQDGAHRYYQKVMEIDPNNAEAQQFMKLIEKQYQNKEMMKLMDELQDT